MAAPASYLIWGAGKTHGAEAGAASRGDLQALTPLTPPLWLAHRRRNWWSCWPGTATCGLGPR